MKQPKSLSYLYLLLPLLICISFIFGLTKYQNLSSKAEMSKSAIQIPKIEVQGKFRYLHYDDLEGKISGEMKILTDAETFKLFGGGNWVIQKGEVKVLTILFNFADDQAQFVRKEEAIAGNDFAGAYFRANSFNQLTVTGNVTDWLTIPLTKNEKNCKENLDSFTNEADKLARNNGFDPKDYNKIVYIFPYSKGGTFGCSFNAFSYPTDNKIYIVANPEYLNYFYVHELGHSLGNPQTEEHVYHSETIFCNGKQIDRYDRCNLHIDKNNYSDFYDIMGGSTSGGFNSIHRELANWLSMANIVTATTGTNRYTLYPLETANTLYPKVLKIQKPDTAEYYYVEYRSINDIPLKRKSGATIRIRHNIGKDIYSLLIDANPQTVDDFTDASLTDGASFVDQDSNVKITQVSHSEQSVNLQVEVGTPRITPTPTPPPPTDVPSPTDTPVPTNTPLPTATPTLPQIAPKVYYQGTVKDAANNAPLPGMCVKLEKYFNSSCTGGSYVCDENSADNNGNFTVSCNNVRKTECVKISFSDNYRLNQYFSEGPYSPYHNNCQQIFNFPRPDVLICPHYSYEPGTNFLYGTKNSIVTLQRNDSSNSLSRDDMSCPLPVHEGTRVQGHAHWQSMRINDVEDYSGEAYFEILNSNNVMVYGSMVYLNQGGDFEKYLPPAYGPITNGRQYDVTIKRPGYLKSRIKNLTWPQDFSGVLDFRGVFGGDVVDSDPEKAESESRFAGDDKVDNSDLVFVGGRFNLQPQPGNYQWDHFDHYADINNDGVINIFDLVLVGSNFYKEGETIVNP